MQCAATLVVDILPCMTSQNGIASDFEQDVMGHAGALMRRMNS